MAIGALVGKAAGLVVTGLAGAAAYDGVKKVTRGPVIRGAAVTVTSWGLRTARAAETGAEKARLTTADIVNEAREKIGEQAPVPGSGQSSDHDHQH
jgi:putative effector of murein hydrolase